MREAEDGRGHYRQWNPSEHDHIHQQPQREDQARRYSHSLTRTLSIELSVSKAQAKRIVFLIDWWSRRVEEVSARGVLAVWEDTGGAGVQDAKAQGAGVGGLRGRVLRHQCASPNAGLSFLRQAHGNISFTVLNPPLFSKIPMFCITFRSKFWWVLVLLCMEIAEMYETLIRC